MLQLAACSLKDAANWLHTVFGILKYACNYLSEVDPILRTG